MAENYKEFLAERVVSGAQPVTYRLLSRALKTNVNIAKQMLFDFHAKQNAKKPNSVHATYLLTGKKRTHEHTNGANGSRQDGDIPMQSSPYMSSMPEPTEEPSAEPTPKTSIVLVREEEMEKTQAEFEEVTSIHIYSVEPGPIENMNVLSVCNQEIATHQAGEDPMDRWRTYGGINNPHVKRRTTKYAPPNVVPAQTATLKPTTKAAAPSLASKETSGPEGSGSVSEGNTSGRSTPQPTLSATSKKSDAKSTLRKDKSDIFKSFAKAKPKLKEAGLAKESTPAPAEDAPMSGMSEDEGGEDAPEVKFDQEKAEAAKRARAERDEQLKKMMQDSDDEDMPDAPPEEGHDSQDAPIDKTPETQAGESEANITSQGGRRRGRRKVMKKKTVKDEDGYLVTKEEAAWESFSEEEPALKKPKPAPKPAPTAKGKKTGKQGQGSIASFFKKA